MRGLMRKKQFGAWVMILVTAFAATAAETGTPPGAAKMRLRLKVLKAYTKPVIDEKTPGTETMPGGFECGNTVKVMIDGQPEYHFFALRMPELTWVDYGSDQWMSKDGFNWRRVGALTTMYFDEQKKKYMQDVPPQPFYDEANKRWMIFYCRFECQTRHWQSGSTLWCATSKVEGMKGIYGPYDFPGKQILFPGTSFPKESVCQSITAPFQTKDGRWAVLMGGNDAPFRAKYGKWWLLVTTAPSPHGPYTFDEKHSPATMITPTGYIENPTVTKVRGPLTGREYWVACHDFLAPEDNAYPVGHVFGFSWSEDGLDWPMTQGQIVDINEGLAPGETGWWKGAWAVRTPHQLIAEDDGTYTVFFTGASTPDYFKGFRAVGRLKVQVIEEPVQ